MAVPGLASVLPQPGATHPRPEHGCCIACASAEPALLCPGRRDTARTGHPPSTSARGRGREGRSAAHSPQHLCPRRGVRWQESTWALTAASAAFSTHLSASATEAQGREQKACQKSASYHCTLYLQLTLSIPQVVIAGKFHFSHYLTKPTISMWGAVQAQQPLSLQSIGINKILLAA